MLVYQNNPTNRCDESLYPFHLGKYKIRLTSLVFTKTAGHKTSPGSTLHCQNLPFIVSGMGNKTQNKMSLPFPKDELSMPDSSIRGMAR